MAERETKNPAKCGAGSVGCREDAGSATLGMSWGEGQEQHSVLQPAPVKSDRNEPEPR